MQPDFFLFQPWYECVPAIYNIFRALSGRVVCLTAVSAAVLVYQCGRMADNCGECLALEPRFSCGWCESAGRCQVKDECIAPPWLDRNRPCPNPQVSTVDRPQFTGQSRPDPQISTVDRPILQVSPAPTRRSVPWTAPIYRSVPPQPAGQSRPNPQVSTVDRPQFTGQSRPDPQVSTFRSVLGRCRMPIVKI